MPIPQVVVEMEPWKKRLYDGYVATGQAAEHIDRTRGLALSQYPQLVRLIKTHVPDDKNLPIVDLGCGHGSLVYCLRELGFENVRGVDVSPEQIDLAHRLGIENVECSDINFFLESQLEKVGVIFLMDVIEHLTKDEVLVLLDRVNARLRHDGMVIIHVPNAEGIFGMRVRYGDLTHENAFTPGSVRQVLRACGFVGVKCFEDKPVVHGMKSFVRFLLWKVLSAPFRLLLSAETGVTGHVLSQNMLVVARKSA